MSTEPATIRNFTGLRRGHEVEDLRALGSVVPCSTDLLINLWEELAPSRTKVATLELRIKELEEAHHYAVEMCRGLAEHGIAIVAESEAADGENWANDPGFLTRLKEAWRVMGNALADVIEKRVPSDWLASLEREYEQRIVTLEEALREADNALDLCGPLLRRLDGPAAFAAMRAENNATAHATAVLAGLPSSPAMDAIVVLRDRLYSAMAFVGHVVEELEEGIPHEDAAEFVVRSVEAIRATDALDPTDRSAPGWESAAESRRTALVEKVRS